MIEIIEKIGNKTDFIHFLNLLSKDFEENPQEWENQTISKFLEQMASWVEDYSTCPLNNIEWESIDFKVLAQIIYMGKIYEWYKSGFGGDNYVFRT